MRFRIFVAVPPLLAALILGVPDVVVAGAIADAGRVFDACKAHGFSGDRCRNLVTSSNFDNCYQKCATKIPCFDTCALKDHQGTPVPWALRGERPRLAAEFCGRSETDLVKRFGPPIKVRTSNSPDGKYRMLVFSEQDGAETFFTIFAKDGVVSSGMYKGVAFDDSASKTKKE
jgi:hypothetical protein